MKKAYLSLHNMIWAAVSVAICFFFPITSPIALASGIILALVFKIPSPSHTLSKNMLQISVIGLGAGVELHQIINIGPYYFAITLVSIVFTLIIGLLFTRVFKQERDLGTLISVGTAICGGSAIAAVAPAIRARPHFIATSLAIVFTLNSVALFIFPPIGHFFSLTPEQFGLWSALAIHDTSSVVGATLAYSPDSVLIGTTLKLSRALWIIPVTFVFILIQPSDVLNPNSEKSKIKLPYFIFFFLAVVILFSFFPTIKPYAPSIDWASKRLLVATLFIIGLSFSQTQLKKTPFRAFLMGITLWCIVSVLTLAGILYH